MPRETTAEEATFHAGDMVTWREGVYPKWLPDQRAKLGEGPFRVVSVMTLNKKSLVLFRDQDVHPQQVFIEVPGQPHPLKFSGNWFKKMTAPEIPTSA